MVAPKRQELDVLTSLLPRTLVESVVLVVIDSVLDLSFCLSDYCCIREPGTVLKK